MNYVSLSVGSQCQGEKMVTDAICPFSMTCGREEMVTGSPAGQLCVHTQGGRLLEKGVTFLFAYSPLAGMEMDKLHLW